MFKRALIAIVAVLVVAGIYLSNLVTTPNLRASGFLNGEVLTMDPNSILRPSAFVVGVLSQ